MNEQNRKALIVAYFLSKFDMRAYKALECQNRSQAHQSLAMSLGVKPATLKNMRDQFDPLHGHRDGWHQRELSPSRVEVVEKYKNKDFEFLLKVVRDLLKNRSEDMKDAFLAVCDFCRNYPVDLRGGLPTGDPRVAEVKSHLAVLTEWIQSVCNQHFSVPLTVRHARGAGAFPRIPYIVILPPGQRTNDGVYVSICFGKEGAGAIAGFAQSVEHPRPDFPSAQYDPARIDVGPFNTSYANPLEIDRASFDQAEVEQHLIKSMQQCLKWIGTFPDADSPSLPFSLETFRDDLASATLKTPEAFAAALCSALHSKPFLILTGLSGSGKTQLAQAFSQWICESDDQIELIAVGADWTSNENLLGYPDALNAGRYRKPDNGVLDLILRAKDDSENPYFLILDEMNLSHVERYFADFLSAMESGETISLHDDTSEDWNGVPAKLEIPKNLFVIGTVNVDETTYMFSPKVLDRANVIEFRVSDEEMKSFLENPAKPELDALAGQGAAYAKAFVAAAKQKDVALDEELKTQISGVLMEFFPSLKEAGAEFGYRTAHEICRFIYFHKELSGAEWMFDGAMDAAIMQKLLPKLHGSKKKLGPVLETLIRLCLKEAIRPETTPVAENLLTEENALYWGSLEKLARMRKRLTEHGFTSFAEA